MSSENLLDHSVFENAIKNQNFILLEKLFAKGHKLCGECWSNVGHNNLDFVQFLIKYDNSFINHPLGDLFVSSSGEHDEVVSHTCRQPTALMVYVNVKEADVKFMLEHGADANALDQDGRNVLFYAVLIDWDYCLELVLLLRTLIEAGADPHIRDADGFTLLHWAIVKGCDIDLLKFLIEEIKIDPLVMSNANKNVLSSAMYLYFTALEDIDSEYIRTQILIKKRFTVMKYLFELPHFQNVSFQLIDNHLQIRLFSKLDTVQKISDFDFFLKPLFINTVGELIQTNYIYSSLGQHQFRKYCSIGPVGIYLNKCVFTRLETCTIGHFLQKISSLGMRIIDPPDCFSPLVIFLLNIESKQFSIKYVTAIVEDDQDDLHENNFFQLVKRFVEGGAYVGQRVMQQQCRSEALTQLAEEIHLPDAFFTIASVSNGDNPWYHKNASILCVRYLLPHLAAPPLALALFHDSTNDSDMYLLLLPILFEFGPVPPGTRLLAMLRQNFADLVGYEPMFQPLCQAFEEMHRSPPSLMHLCRSQIRLSLAAQMPRYLRGLNLPDLIATLTKIPPPLRVYLQMWPQEPLNVVVCDNQQIADRANYIIQIITLYNDSEF